MFRLDDRHAVVVGCGGIGGEHPQRPSRAFPHRDRGHERVERQRPGVVGDDERAPVGGDVLGTAHLDPEPLLEQRTQDGLDHVVGEMRVEAEIVDLVIAGHAPPHEFGRADDLGDEGIAEVVEQSTGIDGLLRLALLPLGRTRRHGAVRASARRTTRTGVQRDHLGNLCHRTSVRSPRADSTIDSALSTHSVFITRVRPMPRAKSSSASRVVHRGSKPSSVRMRVVSRPQPKWK